jgi:aminoglycoside 6'-N-acetyltransferase
MLLWASNPQLHPPPPPRLEPEQHDEEDAADDEPKDYSFRAVTAADLPMLARWLRAPLVMAWWGDPEEQYALLQEDLANPLMTMRIVSHLGKPFAYAQDYDVGSWPQAHFARLPAGARSIDAFIGEPDMTGRGHGPAFLRLLAQRLVAEGAPAVVIDPDVDNLRARRAYSKAGFGGEDVVETRDGPVVLMTFAG